MKVVGPSLALLWPVLCCAYLIIAHDKAASSCNGVLEMQHLTVQLFGLQRQSGKIVNRLGRDLIPCWIEGHLLKAAVFFLSFSIAHRSNVHLHHWYPESPTLRLPPLTIRIADALYTALTSLLTADHFPIHRDSPRCAEECNACASEVLTRRCLLPCTTKQEGRTLTIA